MYRYRRIRSFSYTFMIPVCFPVGLYLNESSGLFFSASGGNGCAVREEMIAGGVWEGGLVITLILLVGAVVRRAGGGNGQSAEPGDGSSPTPLSQERELNRALLDALAQPAAVASMDGTLYRWNDRFSDQVLPSGSADGPRDASSAKPDRGPNEASERGEPITLWDVFGSVHRGRLHDLRTEAEEEGEATALMAPIGSGRADAPSWWTARCIHAEEPLLLLVGAPAPPSQQRQSSEVRTAEGEDADGDRERQCQYVVENVADVITRHTADTTCTFATPSVEGLLGYKPEEIIGQPCVDLMHPEDRPQTWTNIDRALDGEIVKRRARLRHKDGHYVWVEMTSRKWTGGQDRSASGSDALPEAQGSLVVSTRNVTDRVLAEKALQESEKRLRQLAENVQGVFWLRTKDTYLYVSPAYERIWGRPIEELYQDPEAYLTSIHPEDRDRVIEAMDREWDEGELTLEYRIVRPDGTVRWVHSVAGRVETESGPNRYAGYAVDVTNQKAQEEALRQSEERWRRLVETHIEPILISVEGTIRYINPSGAELLGAESPGDLVGRSVRSFVTQEYEEDVETRLAELEAGRATEPFEYRVRRLDGKTRIVESQSVPIQYDGEQAAQTVLRDITDWRAAQNKLEYRVLLENLIVDLSTRFIDMEAGVTDERIEAALGRIGPFVGADRCYVFLFDNEADTLSNTHEWCGPGVAPQKDMIQEVPQDRFAWLMEQLHVERSIHVPDVADLPPEAAEEQSVLVAQNVQSLVLVPMSDGRRLIGFVGFDAVKQKRMWESETIMLLRVLGDTFANALMRKEAEQALREREAQYRSVVENVRDVVFQTDIDGHWTFLNPAWEGMTGYSVEDTLGNPCLAYFKGPELDAMTEVFDGTRSFCRSEVRLRTRDGSVRWVALFAQSLQEEDGALTGVVGTLHDITERKRMEQQTREALRRERELNRLKSSVVSMVSHEFRTPLSTIRSSAEMLGEFFDEWSPEKRKKYVDRIHRQIDRMSRLLGDVITTSKLDAEHDEPNPVSLDLRRFQREVADEVRAHLGTDRAVSVEMHDVPDEIEVDPDLLHHIVSNLLSNALKYSPDETEVSVTWEVRGETLSVCVSDRGIGIPTSDQEHLFRAFFRAGNVGSAEGSGLGTTIVKRAVDVYGGTISVDSASGEGTTFRITLPL